MPARPAITVYKPRAEVEQLWKSSRPEYIAETDAAVSFTDAPGDRGTEIRVDLDQEERGGKLGEIVGKLTGSDPRAKVMDDLRRFKQIAETGVIAQSDASPEGELAERKLKQRPAQPLEDAEAEKAGV